MLDVPSSATARVLQLSRGGGRKNDEIDAAAAATIAALHGDARPVQAEDQCAVLALLDERRVSLAQARVRAVNQLHALLRDLIPGGAPRQLSAHQAGALLRRIRPAGAVETVRKQVAGDLVREIRTLDAQLADNAARMQAAVEASDSTLMHTPGIGPVMAARLIARTGRAERFPPVRRMRTIAGLPRSRSPALTRPATGSPAAVTGSSTRPCTPSPSSRSACPTVPATPTTSASSPRARARKRLSDA